jgi:Gpi18-like mannosyltransferase
MIKASSKKTRFGAFSLAAILTVGFLVRVAVSNSEGNTFDVGVNQGWGKSAVHFGIARSYEEQLDGNMLPNYAPFIVMLFTGMAHINELARDPFQSADVFRLLIKLPGILADIMAAALFYFAISHWKDKKMGLVAASIVSLHPAAIYNSAVWGQTDSVYAFFVAATIFAFYKKHFFLAGMMLSMGLLSKMQAVYALPLIGILFLRSTPRAVIHGALGFSTATLLIFSPFLLEGNLQKVLGVYVNSVGFYPVVSSAAYNFWWTLFGDSAGSINDTDTAIWPLNYRQIGLALFGLSYAYALYVGWGHLKNLPKSKVALPYAFTVAAFLAHAFFMLNTEMHERYLFPLVFMGIPMAFFSAHAAVVYASISGLYFMNLLGWLPASWVDKALYSSFPTLDVVIAVLQTVLLFHFAYLLRKLSKGQPTLYSYVRGLLASR